jgi:hypothetical protein
MEIIGIVFIACCLILLGYHFIFGRVKERPDLDKIDIEERVNLRNHD